MAKAQLSFLEDLLLKLLNQHGFDKLSEEDQKGFLPQFVAEAERRMGIALAPYLNDKTAKEFDKLASGNASSEEWYKFWKANVPDFDQVVNKALESFVKEMAAAFQI